MVAPFVTHRYPNLPGSWDEYLLYKKKKKERKERNSPVFITGGDFALLNTESMEVVFYPPHETERIYLPGCSRFKEMVPGPGERPVPGLSDS